MCAKKTIKKLLIVVQNLLLALLSGTLLALAFLDHQYFYCAWLAFIPLLFAIEKASLKASYLIGLITGLSFFTTATYWILDFIQISKDYGVNSGYFLSGVYWFYSAHCIALAVPLFKWLKQHSKAHEFLLFPLTFVVFTAAYPMLFSIRLGSTQVGFHSALQAIEFVGVHGLDLSLIHI